MARGMDPALEDIVGRLYYDQYWCAGGWKDVAEDFWDLNRVEVLDELPGWIGEAGEEEGEASRIKLGGMGKLEKGKMYEADEEGRTERYMALELWKLCSKEHLLIYP